MKYKYIYLSGAITNIPESEAKIWRYKTEDFLRDNYSDAKVFNPIEHFTFEDLNTGYVSDDEIMKIEIDRLRKSDLVIYNCHYPKSLGSMAELAIAYDRNIPIFAFNEQQEQLHPWIKGMCTKIFHTQDELHQFLLNHFLFY